MPFSWDWGSTEKIKPCTTCNGTGKVTCPECNGEGHAMGPDGKEHPCVKEMTCTSCGGKGVVL